MAHVRKGSIAKEARKNAALERNVNAGDEGKRGMYDRFCLDCRNHTSHPSRCSKYGFVARKGGEDCHSWRKK